MTCEHNSGTYVEMAEHDTHAPGHARLVCDECGLPQNKWIKTCDTCHGRAGLPTPTTSASPFAKRWSTCIDCHGTGTVACDQHGVTSL